MVRAAYPQQIKQIKLLPCARMRSRVMHLVLLVCVSTYVRICIYICRQRNRLFSALLLEKLLLHVSVIYCLLFEFKHLQCGLLHPASYTDRVIHAFPNKTSRSPWPQNIFLWALTAHHTLWAMSVSDAIACMQTGMCSAEHQQLVWEPAARAVLWTEMYSEVHAQCAQGMCSLEL